MGRARCHLDHAGREVGKIRNSPVIRVEHDGLQVPGLVPQRGGRPPGRLQDGSARQEMLAREVNGDGKALWWARAIEALPDYAEHHKNMDRDIAVLVLESASQVH
ncbi:nitroreductase family deazaflavin-dependent oxidoreductase [Streptomyces canus]|uniref:nitroreductase/quinone reductase family protein n=1 Tax=Streptomyces TaxID=1883 RepID=UPI0030E142ED